MAGRREKHFAESIGLSGQRAAVQTAGAGRLRSSEQIAIGALGIAAVCVATRVLQFPIPLGYAHLGNCVILLFGALFGPGIGAIAGGAGSALADLLSFPEWALPTLIIKSIMGAIAGLAFLAVRNSGSRERKKSTERKVFLAVFLAIVEMVLGYFVAGSILYGSVAAGATQIPGLSAEGVIGIVLFYPLREVVIRSGIVRGGRLRG